MIIDEIDNHKKPEHRLFLDYRYQSINWHRLSSIDFPIIGFIDCSSPEKTQEPKQTVRVSKLSGYVWENRTVASNVKYFKEHTETSMVKINKSDYERQSSKILG